MNFLEDIGGSVIQRLTYVGRRERSLRRISSELLIVIRPSMETLSVISPYHAT